MSALIQVRMIVPDDQHGQVIAFLLSHDGATNVVVFRDAAVDPSGHLVMFDVARESSNEILDMMNALGVEERGSISVVHAHLSLGTRSDEVQDDAPGEADSTVVWAEVDDRVSSAVRMSASYLIFFAVAAIIAAVGVIADSPVLIVGAMVVGPEYGPIAGIAYGLERRSARWFLGGNVTLLVGSVLGVVAAFLVAVLIRATGRTPDAFLVGTRQLTDFVSNPDLLSAIVACTAAVAGMIALAHAREGTLVGVLVSVTTMPAIAACGVALAYADWAEVWGSIGQFTLNVTCMILVGALTVRILRLRTPRSMSPLRRPTL